MKSNCREQIRYHHLVHRSHFTLASPRSSTVRPCPENGESTETDAASRLRSSGILGLITFYGPAGGIFHYARRSRRRRPAVESRDPRLPAGDERPAAGFRASSPRAFLGGVQAVPRAVALAGLLESDVAGAAVASARRRAAAAGAATYLLVAARAQVIPPDEPVAGSRRPADLSSSAG